MGERSELARQFLDLFNKIDRHLRVLFQIEDSESFRAVLNAFRGKQPSGQQLAVVKQLRLAANVRNAMEHGKKSHDNTFQYPCFPSEDIVANLIRIWKKLDSSVSAIKCWRACELYATDWKTNLASLFQVKNEKNFTHFPVFGNGGLLEGLFVFDDVVSWISQQVRLGTTLFDFDDCVIEDVAPAGKVGSSFKVFDPNTPANKIIEFFGNNSSIQAVFLSPGKSLSQARIQRIVTRWDIVNYFHDYG